MVATRTKRNPSGPLPPEPRIIPETVEEEEGHNVGFIFDNTDPGRIRQSISWILNFFIGLDFDNSGQKS